MDIATYLDQQLRAAGIPIIGVSVRNPADRSTWRIEFAPDATDQQKAAAADLLTTQRIDVGVLADADLSERLTADKLYRATVIWIAGLMGKTPAQARAEIIAIYKAL